MVYIAEECMICCSPYNILLSREGGVDTAERRYSTYVITEALRFCGMKIGDVKLAQDAQAGTFTAKRVRLYRGKPVLAATAKDVQTYLIITGRGSAPLWLLRGLLDQAADHVIAWTTVAARTQKAIDKEFDYDSD